MRRARDVPAGAMRPGVPGVGELPEPEAQEPSVDEQAIARVEHAERVADLRTLKARERRDLYLHALGYEYKEICELTASSYTAVNRRLVEGRAELRRLERERRDRAERREPEERDDDEGGELASGRLHRA